MDQLDWDSPSIAKQVSKLDASARARAEKVLGTKTALDAYYAQRRELEDKLSTLVRDRLHIQDALASLPRAPTRIELLRSGDAEVRP
jgi:hypothetical protein